MIGFNRDSLIPVLSLLAGAAAACLIALWVQQPQQDLQVAMEQFGELAAGEQEQVRNVAAFYLNSSRYGDRMRIEAIHQAATSDPALMEKLERLKAFSADFVDEEAKTRLKPNGNFSPDWVTAIEELYRQKANAVRVIEIRLPFWVPGPAGTDPKPETLRVTEQQFIQFLNAAIPADVPQELQEKLDGLDGTDQQCERILTKITWLMQQLLSAKNENIDADRIANAATKHMISSEDAEQIRRFLQWNPPPPMPPGTDREPDRTAEFVKQMQIRFARGKAMIFLRDPLNFYEEIFHSTHIPESSDAAEVFDTELNRETQLQLMKMDPVDAAIDLDHRIIEDMRIADPAIAGLNRDLKALHERFRESEMQRRSGRSGFSRWSGHWPGSPDNAGGGPPRKDGPGTQRDDERGLPRRDGGGPPRNDGHRGGPPERRDGDHAPGDEPSRDNGQRNPPSEQRDR